MAFRTPATKRAGGGIAWTHGSEEGGRLRAFPSDPVHLWGRTGMKGARGEAQVMDCSSWLGAARLRLLTPCLSLKYHHCLFGEGRSALSESSLSGDLHK